jgi:hypothetical protein
MELVVHRELAELQELAEQMVHQELVVHQELAELQELVEQMAHQELVELLDRVD